MPFFLDVAKTFDSISHKILGYKLQTIGFKGPFLCLPNSFLLDRRQLASVGGVQSAPVLLKAGVPQGSILSPLSFDIYVNDIFKAVLLSYLQICR